MYGRCRPETKLKKKKKRKSDGWHTMKVCFYWGQLSDEKVHESSQLFIFRHCKMHCLVSNKLLFNCTVAAWVSLMCLISSADCVCGVNGSQLTLKTWFQCVINWAYVQYMKIWWAYVYLTSSSFRFWIRLNASLCSCRACGMFKRRKL